MSGDRQMEINRFAIDLQNVSAKVTSIFEEETREFLSQKHKYKSLKEFHEAHPKGRCQMKAEFLAELGYRKASEVVFEIIGEILSNHTPDIDGFFMMHETELAELKKKYESEKDK